MIHRTIFVFGMSMLLGGLVSLSMALEKTEPIPKKHHQPTTRHAYGHLFSCPPPEVVPVVEGGDGLTSGAEVSPVVGGGD